jgi:phosphoribosylglycinamide formyltransferase 1
MSVPESDTRLAVLLSGLGSTYAAVQDACDAGQCQARIVQVLSDRAGAGGLGTAKDRGIPADTLPRQDYANRTAHEAALIAAIEAAGAHWVILAGYMRILGAAFVRHFQGRMLNTHPSLLPRYRGLNTYQRALQAGDSLHGCSIHFVTEDLDGGPVIARAEVPVYEGDTAAELERRTKARERKLYPLIIDLAARNRLHMHNEGILLDGKPLRQPLRLPWGKETLE